MPPLRRLGCPRHRQRNAFAAHPRSRCSGPSFHASNPAFTLSSATGGEGLVAYQALSPAASRPSRWGFLFQRINIRDGTTFSHLAGAEVSNWSEEWRHECEVAAVLAMSPTQRKSFFEGKTMEDGRKERGVVDIRGADAAEKIRQDMYRLEELRRAPKR
ncbi:DUF7696 family protein [Salinarimonas soli]|uniref:Uncharacterized protein n=1 Tax=Salinarimonas soli TaxID=1638099 RepID=A0A5B2VSF5_9HYPH|nr:hypothetical protein F0L46_04890 [Salinarimonas soli]